MMGKKVYIKRYEGKSSHQMALIAENPAERVANVRAGPEKRDRIYRSVLLARVRCVTCFLVDKN